MGSTIKPYVYTLAMENGFSPCDQVRHVEQTLIDENGRPWSPRNASKKRYGEMVTIKWGLANSDNWVTAYLMGKLNPYQLVRLIHSFGVQNKQIDPVVSLCLGPCEISVGEMVSAYSAFANRGIRTAPVFVTRIEDNEGNVLANFTPQMDEVISEQVLIKCWSCCVRSSMKVRVGVYAVYMVLLPIWEERQVQPTVILTVVHGIHPFIGIRCMGRW